MDQMAQKAGRLALRLGVLSREQLCVLAAAGCAQVTQVLVLKLNGEIVQKDLPIRG